MKLMQGFMTMGLLVIATAAHAADAPLSRTEVKRQTLMAICLGEETSIGDSGKTSRDEFPEDYKRRAAMCNQWIAAMPAAARKADAQTKQ